MTKIKNTKKGMAKKTLSISLAVAMLATSNVPVWAAEFTDGTDAAFTSEAVVETPVEEVVTEVEAVKVKEENSKKDKIVLEKYNYTCLICGCREETILEAAHIIAVAP